ncbi:hypothetical protein KP509_38G038900 [Ceratopteris richardii]|uniref:ACT domain-containing protein n=1 Tax=Ceratopteris richardii TaxID=49495 RepID=A0A8T2Q340_CERRI|nr:hypothetical protein KP509_38G038900 [Ceratopteris richardii]
MDGSNESGINREGESSADRLSKRSTKSSDEVFPSRQSFSYQQEVCKEVLRKLREANCEAVHLPGFEENIVAHFMRLPTRYALDVNVDQPEDVLLHRDLLQRAEIPENRPVVHVRPVKVLPTEVPEGNELPTPHASAENQISLINSSNDSDFGKLQDHSVYAPAFGKLDSLSIGSSGGVDDEMLSSRSRVAQYPIHEVTFSTVDKTKLLSQLSSILADVGLNIREAHVFSTSDGYSLDVFIVHGWEKEVCNRIYTV